MPYEDSSKNKPGGQQPQVKKPQNLTMENRRRLSVSGVEDVESFDEREIVMRTVEGNLIVSGEGLSVSRLSVDSGEVSVQGRISELRYEEPAPERRGFLARLLH